MSLTDDRVAIRDVIERYSRAVTKRAWADLVPLFHPDATWGLCAPFDRSASGPQAIADSIALAARFEFLVQTVGWAVVEPDEDTATAEVLVYEFGRLADQSGGIDMRGIYHDTLVRRDGGWVFMSRSFQPLVLDRALPSGEAFRP